MILLVERDQRSAAWMRRVLEETDFAGDIVILRTGSDALSYVFGVGKDEQTPAPDLPALVLLALDVPVLDGLTIVRRLRGDERTVSLPIVVLTSSEMETDLVESLRLGAVTCAKRPVDAERLSEAVRGLGLSWSVG